MKATELYYELERRIPKGLSEEWDNDGIMLLPGDKEINNVLIALDVTPKVAKEAIEGGYDLIITHHPMIFHPLKSVRDEKIINLLKNDVCVFSFHTRLDTVAGGVNDTLCDLLGLKDVTLFCEMGRVGKLKHSMNTGELCKLIKEKTFAPSVNASCEVDKISTAALLGGGGKDFFKESKDIADVYITGEMSYNTMLDASEMGICVIEAGHFYTEFPVCKTLENMIGDIDAGIKTHIMFDYPIKSY